MAREKDRKPQFFFRLLCENAFNTYTESLEEHKWGDRINDAEDGSTNYALLVATHTIITNKIINAAGKELQEADDQLKKRISGRRLLRSDWAEVIRVEEQAPPEARENLGHPRFYFRVNKIVQMMKSENSGIRQELARFEVKVTDAAAQLAWWMMMIRGVAWDMSCYREQWPDQEFVPSTFYRDPRPVMLA